MFQSVLQEKLSLMMILMMILMIGNGNLIFCHSRKLEVKKFVLWKNDSQSRGNRNYTKINAGLIPN